MIKNLLNYFLIIFLPSLAFAKSQYFEAGLDLY